MNQKKKAISIAEFEEKISSLHDTLLEKLQSLRIIKEEPKTIRSNLLKYAAESFILKFFPFMMIFKDTRRRFR